MADTASPKKPVVIALKPVPILAMPATLTVLPQQEASHTVRMDPGLAKDVIERELPIEAWLTTERVSADPQAASPATVRLLPNLANDWQERVLPQLELENTLTDLPKCVN